MLIPNKINPIMCIHCLRTLSDVEYELWVLSEFSLSFLQFLFTMGPPLGRTCIQIQGALAPLEDNPVTDTSKEKTPCYTLSEYIP